MPAKILIVDDYAYNRLVYGDWLRELRHVEVVEAATGPRALQLAREHDFALFVVDAHMPDMDGFELASLLRQEECCEATPVILVSAEASESADAMRAYRMGAVDYLVDAPQQGEILVQKARVFLQLYRRQRKLRRNAEALRRRTADLQARLDEVSLQQDDLRAQATHDSLTQLPNRALFQDRLLAAKARAVRHRQRFALAFVDLDKFKAVNDEHGHAAGDAVIVAAAGRLARAVRATDTVARIGGDEFAVLIEGLESAAGAEYVARKIHRTLGEPLAIRSETFQGEVQLAPGASIGVAVYPDHSSETDGLGVLADMAMYEAKRLGGGVHVYTQALGEVAERKGAHLRPVQENRRRTLSH